MPVCAEVNQAMEEITGVKYNKGEQNKDMTKARQAHDWKDTLTVLSYLQKQNPFSNDPGLLNTATGEHAFSIINVDTARSVGDAILEWMDKHLMSTTSRGKIKLSLWLSVICKA